MVDEPAGDRDEPGAGGAGDDELIVDADVAEDAGPADQVVGEELLGGEQLVECSAVSDRDQLGCRPDLRRTEAFELLTLAMIDVRLLIVANEHVPTFANVSVEDHRVPKLPSLTVAQLVPMTRLREAAVTNDVERALEHVLAVTENVESANGRVVRCEHRLIENEHCGLRATPDRSPWRLTPVHRLVDTLTAVADLEAVFTFCHADERELVRHVRELRLKQIDLCRVNEIGIEREQEHAGNSTEPVVSRSGRTAPRPHPTAP